MGKVQQWRQLLRWAPVQDFFMGPSSPKDTQTHAHTYKHTNTHTQHHKTDILQTILLFYLAHE